MRGKKTLKVLAWIAGILVVLIIAGIVALRILLPPERLRALALPKIEQALGQRVGVGPIHLKIWGGFGLSIEDLSLGNRPGYHDDLMLEVDELVLRIPLRPLLDHKLEVRQIALVRPKLSVEKSADGQINVQGFGQRLSSTDEEPEPGRPRPSGPSRPIALPIPITLEEFRIKDGEVKFVDSATGFSALIHEIDHHASLSIDRDLRDIALRGDLSAESVTLTPPGVSKPLPPFDLKISHRAKADLTRSMLDLEAVKVSVMGAEILVTGTVEDFVDPILKLKAETFTDLAQLPVSEGTSVTGKVTSDLETAGPVLRPEQISVKGNILAERVDLHTQQMQVPVTNLSGEVRFSGQDMDVPRLAGAFGSSRFSLKCRVAQAIPFAVTGGKVVPDIQFELLCPQLLLDELIPEKPGVDETSGESSGSPAAATEAPGKPLPPIPEVTGRGSVRIQEITARGLEANDFRAAVHIAERQIHVQDLSVGLYSGTLHGSADADLRNPETLPFSLSFEAESLQANDFISALTSFDDHLYGLLDLNADFSASGTTPIEIRRTASAKGHMSVAEGRLVNWDFARKLSQWMKVLEFEDVDFSDLNLDFEVADERVAMHPLKLKALDTWWTADGSAGFDETLDYQVTALLSDALGKSLRDKTAVADLLADGEGRTQLVFSISGSARSPKFGWKTQSIRDRAKEKAESEVREFLEGRKDEATQALLREVDRRLEGETREKAKKLLEGLVKPDSADTTDREQAIEDLKKEGQELLRDLFKKKPKK